EQGARADQLNHLATAAWNSFFKTKRANALAVMENLEDLYERYPVSYRKKSSPAPGLGNLESFGALLGEALASGKRPATLLVFKPHEPGVGPGGQPIFPAEVKTPGLKLDSIQDEVRVEPILEPEDYAKEGPPRNAIQLFDPSRAVHELRALGPSQAESGAQRRTLAQMGGERGLREMGCTPSGFSLKSLYERFPHFSEVLDFIEGSLALAGCGAEGTRIRFPAILLKGPPGTGKTYFAQELARAFGIKFVERDLSITSEAFVLTGLDPSWKSAKHGVVFDTLVNGSYANPLICLNEVDKVGLSGHKNSPLASLFSLLEPTSAERFRDEFIPVEIDAKYVNWVLTANDGPLPDPILSRLEVFEIASPNKDQCRAVAASVWKSLCEGHFPRGHEFQPTLPADVLDWMSELSPRFMRKALTTAASSAAKSKRWVLQQEDLTSSLKRIESTQKKSPMGFTAQI
ncbi:AAA family ATPase, partial [Nostoc sp. CHAB 5834]|nr:AAA family ATPase [Nostoc sp. CHAB 5834]